MIDKILVNKLLISGKTQKEIALELGCSPQNIARLAKIMGISKKDFGSSLKKRLNRETFVANLSLVRGREQWKLDDLGSARSQCFSRKRQAAKSSRWSWDLVAGDITWPTHCPILGLEINYFAEKREENSPSFDRIDPSQGYVKGNVEIVSWRANRIKNDGTAEEHQRICNYMYQYPQEG